MRVTGLRVCTKLCIRNRPTISFLGVCVCVLRLRVPYCYRPYVRGTDPLTRRQFHGQLPHEVQALSPDSLSLKPSSKISFCSYRTSCAKILVQKRLLRRRTQKRVHHPATLALAKATYTRPQPFEFSDDQTVVARSCKQQKLDPPPSGGYP